MLIPLILLSVGAIFAGVFAYDWFVGDGREQFWGESLLVLSGNDSIEAGPPCAELGEAAAAGDGGERHRARLDHVHRQARTCPAWWSPCSGPIHTFIFNKWYFDELYDWAFVRPARALGREPLEDRATAW